MLPSFLLALREGVEIALVIGIVLGVLRKLNRPELKTSLWLGTGLAILASVLVAVGLRLAGAELSGPAEPIFEGVTMWLAAGLLTWMIFWMTRQSRSHSRALEQRVRSTLTLTGRWPLLGLAFLAVFREGLELALFIVATGMADGTMQSIVGASAGLLVAACLGWLLFTSTRRLPISSFFKFTNVLLVLFAAGLFASGMAEFNEASLIPALVPHLYNLNPLLSEESLPGQLLKALFGYSGAPSLTQVLAYAIYFLAIVSALWLYFRRPVVTQA
jgi:high-affinity iron transporter